MIYMWNNYRWLFLLMAISVIELFDRYNELNTSIPLPINETFLKWYCNDWITFSLDDC